LYPTTRDRQGKVSRFEEHHIPLAQIARCPSHCLWVRQNLDKLGDESLIICFKLRPAPRAYLTPDKIVFSVPSTVDDHLQDTNLLQD
jgi:hypothetical protein